MIIGVDFDGTCVTHDYPFVGKDIGAARVLKTLTDKNHQLILYTMRSPRWNANKLLMETNIIDDAVNWFKNNDIPLYGINKNPNQKSWTLSPKPFCHLYIDDAALGIPLTFNKELSQRPYVDWIAVEGLLKNMEIL